MNGVILRKFPRPDGFGQAPHPRQTAEILLSYAYLWKHVADESSFVCDGGTIECKMDIHFRRMVKISDMNVQATGIAATDRPLEPSSCV